MGEFVSISFFFFQNHKQARVPAQCIVEGKECSSTDAHAHHSVADGATGLSPEDASSHQRGRQCGSRQGAATSGTLFVSICALEFTIVTDNLTIGFINKRSIGRISMNTSLS